MCIRDSPGAKQANGLGAPFISFRQECLKGRGSRICANAFLGRTGKVGEFHFNERLVNLAIRRLGPQFLIQLGHELLQLPLTLLKRRQIIVESAFVA